MKTALKYVCALVILSTCLFIGHATAVSLNTGTLYADIIQPNGTSLSIWAHYNTSQVYNKTEAYNQSEVDTLINMCFANDTTLQSNIDAEATQRKSNDTAIATNVSEVNSSLNTHTGDTGNPHSVTSSDLDASVSAAEYSYLDGVTSSIQTQINGKAASSHNHAGGDITSGTVADARIASTITRDSELSSHTSDTENPHSTDIGDGYIFIHPYAYSQIGAGTWGNVYTESTKTLGGAIFTNSGGGATDGDYVNYTFYMGAGTYTLLFVAHSSANQAIIDIDINGVEVASFDNYVGDGYDTRYNQTGITVSSSGVKNLTVRVDGKNPSAFLYQCDYSAIFLWRTA